MSGEGKTCCSSSGCKEFTFRTVAEQIQSLLSSVKIWTVIRFRVSAWGVYVHNKLRLQFFLFNRCGCKHPQIKTKVRTFCLFSNPMRWRKKVKRKQSTQLQTVGKSRTEQHKASLSLHVVSILCCGAEPHPLAHQKTREAPPTLCHTSTRTRREGGEEQNEEQREIVPYLSVERLKTESHSNS